MTTGAQGLIDRWIFTHRPEARLDLAYRVLFLRKRLGKPSKARPQETRQ